jgi:peptidase M50-like protein
VTPAIVLAFALGLYLWMFVQVIVHEAGHLFAARLVGFSPFALTIGKGPLLFRRRLGDLEVRFHTLPFFGMVKARPVLDGLSWRGSLFAIAGLAADTALLGLALQLAPAHGFFALITLYQIVVVATNLVPLNNVIEGAKVPNDGSQFLGYVTGHTAKTLRAYEKSVARYDASFRLDDSWLMRGNLAMVAAFSAAERHMAARRYAEATQRYLQVIRGSKPHPAERALILDSIHAAKALHGLRRTMGAS